MTLPAMRDGSQSAGAFSPRAVARQKRAAQLQGGLGLCKRITGGAVARGMVSVQTPKSNLHQHPTCPSSMALGSNLNRKSTDGSTDTRNLGRARARL